MTEKEKMQKGMWYDANYDQKLLAERLVADDLCYEFNQTRPKDTEKREAILAKLLPNKAKDVSILAPFYADYGVNCVIGEGSFINHGAYLMDCAPITIGKHCFIGPNCGMYTATHAFVADERNKGIEKADPITLKDNVWLGGDVTILPGVTIGRHSVIGSGSVVTHDIPDDVVAVGNPCKVIRPITEEDKINPYRTKKQQ